MNPVALALIALGSLGMVASLVYYVVLQEEFDLVGLIVSVLICSMVEGAGALLLARSRRM